jgi:bis(5'-nucleosyl)-tetraphosphatase (symmetrical)
LQRIFVGDVQGCADELDTLVERARSGWGGEFELWLVGDLVNRGPDNLRVLRRVRELETSGRARSVLGNHEVGLLCVALGLEAPGPGDTFGDVLEAPDRDAWVDWLCRLPLVDTGRLGEQPFALVHAASHPDWTLEELASRARAAEALLRDRRERRRFLAQRGAPDSERDVLARLTECRSVDARGAWVSEPPEQAPQGFAAWHHVWAQRAQGFGIVYGHWSLQGLHVAPWLRGLDTGCVHHGRGRDGFLSAWLPPESAAAPFDVPDANFWQIPARRVYYSPAEREKRPGGD